MIQYTYIYVCMYIYIYTYTPIIKCNYLHINLGKNEARQLVQKMAGGQGWGSALL